MNRGQRINCFQFYYEFIFNEKIEAALSNFMIFILKNVAHLMEYRLFIFTVDQVQAAILTIVDILIQKNTELFCLISEVADVLLLMPHWKIIQVRI